MVFVWQIRSVDFPAVANETASGRIHELAAFNLADLATVAACKSASLKLPIQLPQKVSGQGEGGERAQHLTFRMVKRVRKWSGITTDPRQAHSQIPANFLFYFYFSSFQINFMPRLRPPGNMVRRNWPGRR